MTVVKHVRRLPRIGDTHPETSSVKAAPPKPGTRRVEIALSSSHSGVQARMLVSLPDWPEGWKEEGMR